MAVEVPYFFFADAVQRDQATQKLSVAGLFNVVTCADFPSMLYNCFVVVGVAGPEVHAGDEFSFRVEDPDGKEVGRSQVLKIRSQGAVVSDLIVRFQNVLLPRHGDFSVLLCRGNDIVGRRCLKVTKSDAPKPPELKDRGVVEL